MDENVDPEHLSQLIGDIYDAAVNPLLWVGVLERIVNFVGGKAATLSVRNGASTSGFLPHVYGVEPHWQQLYVDRYIALDPHIQGYLAAEPLEPFTTTDIVPFNQFQQTAFYREFALPQSCVELMGVVLERSVLGLTMLGVLRHENAGFIDADMRARMRLLAPHVRRATLIGRTFEGYRSENATFTDMLNAIDGAAFAVDVSGRVIHANMRGLAMADEGPIRIVSGLIKADDVYENCALREAITRASDGDQALKARGISFGLRTDAGEHYIGQVLSLRSGRRRMTGARYGATATILVRRASLDMQSAGKIIGQAFKLTAAELRVLLGIVEIGGIPEVASALGIGEGTVKTHLKRVFNKTRAKRQADLVKLVAGFADPLKD